MKPVGVLFTPGGEVFQKDLLVDPVTNQLTNTLLRLKKGRELWHSGQFGYWAVSGNCCHQPHIQSIPTAILMKRMLENPEWMGGKPVPEERIIVLHHARDTFEEANMLLGALNSRCIPPIPFYPWWVTTLNPNRSDTFLSVVSHQTHLRRFRASFRRGYGVPIYEVPVDYSIGLKAELIELAAWGYHWWDPRGTGRIPESIRRGRTPQP